MVEQHLDMVEVVGSNPTPAILCLVSSVGRAEDWKSSCQWFDSTSSHHKIAGNKTSFFFYAVKRNIYRFSEEFCFQLNEREFQNLRFQIGTSKQNEELRGGRRYLPYVFTEQGIAMLAGVLKNDIAVKVSINIIKSFIEMRKILAVNGQLFERLTNVEYKLLEHDKKFDKVFDQLQNEENIKQKIFFEGQIYDAYSLIIIYY